MAYDAVKMADWQISEAAEKNMPTPDEWREKLGLEKDEILPMGVQIEEQDRQFLEIAPCLGRRPGQVVPEHLAVRQSGQAVVIGHITNLFVVVTQALPHFPEGLRKVADFIIRMDLDRNSSGRVNEWWTTRSATRKVGAIGRSCCFRYRRKGGFA